MIETPEAGGPDVVKLTYFSPMLRVAQKARLRLPIHPPTKCFPSLTDHTTRHAVGGDAAKAFTREQLWGRRFTIIRCWRIVDQEGPHQLQRRGEKNFSEPGSNKWLQAKWQRYTATGDTARWKIQKQAPAGFHCSSQISEFRNLYGSGILTWTEPEHGHWA